MYMCLYNYKPICIFAESQHAFTDVVEHHNKFCLRRSLITKILACGTFFYKNLVHGLFHFSAFFSLPIH